MDGGGDAAAVRLAGAAVKHDFIEDNLIILSKQTIDAFLDTDCPDDLIALYVFYYYTAKWQKTNLIKATRNYVIKAMGWGKEKHKQANQKLIDLGLIEPFIRRDASGKVKGHYIKIKYLWKRESLVFEHEKPEASKADSGLKGQKNQTPPEPLVGEPTGGKQPTNALSAISLNALIADTEMLRAEALRLSGYLLSRILERKADFKKPTLSKWAVHVERMIKLDRRMPDVIEKVIDWAQADSFWQNNILSANKLREKFDTLELRMQSDVHGKATGTGTGKRQSFSDQKSDRTDYSIDG